jgi:hypothetical protein
MSGQKSSAESYPIRIPFAAMPSHALPFPGFFGAIRRSTHPDGQLKPTEFSRGVGKGAEIAKRLEAPEFSPPGHLSISNSEADKSKRRVGATGSGNLLVSDFDLGADANSPESIEVRKPVLLNGRPAGTILIRIGAASQVFVSRYDVTGLLPSMLTSGLSGEFVTLDQIRKSGVNVRYNAATDALLITM